MGRGQKTAAARGRRGRRYNPLRSHWLVEPLERRALLAATPLASIADARVVEGDAGSVDAVFNVTLSAPAAQDVTLHYRTDDGTAKAVADAANPVINGGFESPQISYEWWAYPPGANLGGWVVEGNGIDIVAGWQDAEGNQAVDLNAGDQGGVYQDVPTTPGQTYLLRYALAGNPERAVPVKQVEVSFGGAQVAVDSFDTTGRSTSDMGWVRKTHVVTATDSTTRLRLLSLTQLTDGGPMIDDVSLLPVGDYVAVPEGTLVIPAGETQGTIRVAVLGDTLNEPDETFTVTLVGDGGGAVGTCTIVNDDTPPAVSVSDAQVTEGTDDGSGGEPVFAEFTISLSRPAPAKLTVNFQTSPGTATLGLPGGDYANESGTLTFEAGETDKIFRVEIGRDAIDEPDEIFFLDLTSASGATLGDDSGEATIIDDDPPPSISIADATVTEGDAGTIDATFPVSLSAASGWPVSVRWSAKDGTATAADNDYVAGAGGVLTFAPGETSKTVSVAVRGDTVLEPNETFFVQLADPTNATLGDDSRGTGTIASDDLPALTVDDVTVTEGNPGGAPVSAVFNLRLAAGVPFPVSVRYDPASGTATLGPAQDGGDVDGQGGTVTFAPFETAKSVTFHVNPDALDEADETFFLNLSDVDGATLATGRAVGTIVDDDPAPTIAVTAPTVTEGDAGTTDAVFSFTLSGPSGRTVTVDYATADGTATAAPGATNLVSDPSFESVPIGVPWRVFSAGQGFGGWVVESGTVEIVSAWQDADGDQSVDLSGLGRGTIYQDVPTTPGRLYLLRFALAGNPQGAPAVKSLEVDFGAASLGQITFDTTGHTTADMGWEYHSFVVTASAAITRLRFISLTDSVHGAMVDDVSLTPLGDYLPVAGTLTFAPGETSKTVTVPVIGDRLDETDETFRLLLSNPAGVVPPPAQLTGTILDDDTIQPDRFEPNDTRQTAADLGTIASRAVSGLTIHAPVNDDYFAFHAGRSGVAVVTASFIPGALGLNFEVLDSSGAVIGSSTGPGGFVRPAVDRNHTLAGVRFPPVVGEVYYVRVYGEQSAADADYTLSVINSSGDRFEPNNAPDLATDLGVLGQSSETGLRIADRLDVDFFHFTAAASGPLAAWLEPRGVQDQALLELFDAAGTRLASVPGSKQQQTVSGEGSPTVLTFQVALGQVYFLRVSHRSPGSVGLMGDAGGLDYDLRISAPGDGPAALPRLSVADIFAPEGNSVSGPKPFIFTVLLSEPASTDVTIRYSTADGTAVAGDGGDYQAASGTLVIPAGATAAPITVMVNADTRLEPNEQFFLNLSGAQGAVLLDGHAVATITNDDVGPPQVAAVYLGGTRWGRSFLNALQTGGLGSFRFGYAVPAGARQLDPLPWAGINQVSIQFVGGEATSDIVADAGDLKVWGAGGRQYAVAGFAWDFSTRTGTWTLAEPVAADTLRLDLDGDSPDGVRNSRGLLDGEWPGGTGGAFPSGDGAAGGTFSFRVNVLPGDANGDGRVTFADLGEIKLRAGRGVADRLPPWSEPAPLQGTRPLSRAALYNPFHDTTADGFINALDQTAARRFLHRALPAGTASIAQGLFGAAPILG